MLDPIRGIVNLNIVSRRSELLSACHVVGKPGSLSGSYGTAQTTEKQVDSSSVSIREVRVASRKYNPLRKPKAEEIRVDTMSGAMMLRCP